MSSNNTFDQEASESLLLIKPKKKWHLLNRWIGDEKGPSSTLADETMSSFSSDEDRGIPLSIACQYEAPALFVDQDKEDSSKDQMKALLNGGQGGELELLQTVDLDFAVMNQQDSSNEMQHGTSKYGTEWTQKVRMKDTKLLSFFSPYPRSDLALTVEYQSGDVEQDQQATIDFVEQSGSGLTSLLIMEEMLAKAVHNRRRNYSLVAVSLILLLALHWLLVEFVRDDDDDASWDDSSAVI